MENQLLLPEAPAKVPDFIQKKIKDMPKRKKTTWKSKVVISLIALSLITGSITYGFYEADKWFDSHDIKFQSPVTFQAPIEITKVKDPKPSEIYESMILPEAKAAVVEAPVIVPKTDKDIILTSKHPNTIWAIYGLESSYGKQDKCQRDDKGFNGLGFGQSLTKSNCFPTFEAAVAAVDVWLTDHANMSIAKQLCLYNTGKANSPCTYHDNFKSIYQTIK